MGAARRALILHKTSMHMMRMMRMMHMLAAGKRCLLARTLT